MPKPTSAPALIPPVSDSNFVHGWKQGIQDNEDHWPLTFFMGLGYMLLNFIPALRTKWSKARKIALANMALMVTITQLLAMMKAYGRKPSKPIVFASADTYTASK